jgi:hypothetical protein
MTLTLMEIPNGALRMYYAASEAYEPDAIDVVHFYDGDFTWVKHGDAIFSPDTTSGEVVVWWDSFNVTSPHVICGDDGYYYLFCAGFRNIAYSSIGVARSTNGLTNWERHTGIQLLILLRRHGTVMRFTSRLWGGRKRNRSGFCGIMGAVVNWSGLGCHVQ